MQKPPSNASARNDPGLIRLYKQMKKKRLQCRKIFIRSLKIVVEASITDISSAFSPMVLLFFTKGVV
jgi:hypothetical protein